MARADGRPLPSIQSQLVGRDHWLIQRRQLLASLIFSAIDLSEDWWSISTDACRVWGMPRSGELVMDLRKKRREFHMSRCKLTRIRALWSSAPQFFPHMFLRGRKREGARGETHILTMRTFHLKWSVYREPEFSASLLQSSVSHDPSQIILICWFAAHGTFVIIITLWYSLMNAQFKRTAFIWNGNLLFLLSLMDFLAK